jgi:hypothetical protein
MTTLSQLLCQYVNDLLSIERILRALRATM